jgi:hypothetical protein
MNERWRFEPQRRVASLVLLVFAVATAAAGFIVPGEVWIYELVAVAVLCASVVVNRRLAWAAVSFLGEIIPPIGWFLRHGRRRLAFGEVIDNMNHTLERFGLPPLDVETVSALVDSAPDEEEEDLRRCCDLVAEISYGKGRGMSCVLEILYRDTYGMPTAGIWPLAPGPERRELARILAAMGELPELESGERMVDLVEWAFGRLRDDLSVRGVKEKIEALYALWLRLSAYAGHLRGAGIYAIPTIDGLRKEIDELARHLPDTSYELMAELILIQAGTRWIGGWAESHAIETADAGKNATVRGLALVALGSYSAESAPMGMPTLPRLGLKVARSPIATDMLLGFLWKRSRTEDGVSTEPGLAELKTSWASWRDEANALMGPGLASEIRSVLRSQLIEGQWPTALPVQRAIAEIHGHVHQILEEFRGLAAAQGSPDPAWQARMAGLLRRLGKPPSPARPGLSPAALVADAKSAVEARLAELAPPGLPSPKTASDLRRGLESFAEDFRPGSRLPSHRRDFAEIFDTLELFREHAGTLARKLGELNDIWKAEVAGGSGYLITFRQIRGGLAEVIDELAEQYGFEHYTPYSRIGVLPRGETFEAFYQRFIGDLDRLVGAVTVPNAGKALPDSVHVGVTVQQISLFHRHDITIGAGALELEPPPGVEPNLDVPALRPAEGPGGDRPAWPLTPPVPRPAGAVTPAEPRTPETGNDGRQRWREPRPPEPSGPEHPLERRGAA